MGCSHYNLSMSREVWLEGPVEGIAPVLQPAAHALMQAQADVEACASSLSAAQLWQSHGTGATAGFHLLHLAGALDRLFTYARGEMLNDAQKAAAKAEVVPHPDMDAAHLTGVVRDAIARAMAQLRATAAESVLEPVRIGRAGLPSTVLGCLFHGAEHSVRHAGQFITTVKGLSNA
jgi:hypothetical protein